MVEGGVDCWEGTSDKALGLNIRSGRVAPLAAPPTSPEPEGDTSVVIRGPQGRARGRIRTSPTFHHLVFIPFLLLRG